MKTSDPDPLPGLGKKIEPPPPEKKPDVIERISKDVIKRNGKYESRDMDPNLSKRQVGPPPTPPPEPEYTPQGYTGVLERIKKQQEDDGFPVNEYGIM